MEPLAFAEEEPVTKRKGIGKKRRFDVFKRDDFTCQYCGRKPPAVTLETDHLIPVAEGGDDGFSNLVTACVDCNSGKGARPLEEKIPESFLENELERVQELLERKRALERIRGIEAEIEVIEGELVGEAAEFWNANRVGWSHFVEEKDHGTLSRFVEKLGMIEVKRAMRIALGNDGVDPDGKWKYFCGICWSQIKEEGRSGQAEKEHG